MIFLNNATFVMLNSCDRKRQGFEMAQLPPPSRSLPIALMRAREAVMGPIRDMLAGEGLSEQQWRLLRVLDAQSPLDATTLARRAALLLPSQTRIVHSMVERGLVTRSRGADRRRMEVAITDEGRAIIARNSDRAVRISDEWRARLGPARYETLLGLLEDLSTEPAEPVKERTP